MYYVYILQSVKTKSLYKGLTDNIERRLNQHYAGQVISTKDKLPLALIHVELCSSRTDARKLEKYFKSGFGRENAIEIYENSRHTLIM